MRRALSVLAVVALLSPAGVAAQPTEDTHDIELVGHIPYGEPDAGGIRPFFASGTDLAFEGDFVYAAEQADQGNTDGGIHIIDVSDPDAPELVGFVDCPAYQNDVAVVEPGVVALAYHSRTGEGVDCPTAVQGGVTLFDVSDPEAPRQLGTSPPLPGGTHTLTVDPGGDYIYASPGGIANGGGTQQILDVSDREAAMFPVHTFQPNRTGCHDFGFFTAVDGRDLGVCVGLTESQIWDLQDPTAPEIVSRIHNPLIQFHHTGIATPDGRYLVIGDEAFGAHDCAGGPTGALWLYDVSTPEVPIPVSYFGIDRAHGDAPASADRVDWCTAHLYNFIDDSYVMVVSWYSGGVNVIDWTDVLDPREIGHYRMDGEYPAGEVSNYWSAYWHEGRIYANDRVRGFDALRWTAFEEVFGSGEATAHDLDALARSLPASPRPGWRAGRFFDTPTLEQQAWLTQVIAPTLSPYSCRLAQ